MKGLGELKSLKSSNHCKVNKANGDWEHDESPNCTCKIKEWIKHM